MNNQINKTKKEMTNDFHAGNKIYVAQSQSMTDISNKENYIRDYILDNPEELGLGKLTPVDREVINNNGSMDALFTGEDNTHYNVEVQLGKADSEHILKAISYSLAEQRKYPDKKHRIVLIAEDFNGRNGDVLRYIGGLMPYIAIKIHMIQAEGLDKDILFFDPYMDIYHERKVDEVSAEYGAKYWNETPARKRALEVAEAITKELDTKYAMTKHYVGVKFNGVNFFSVNQRSSSDHVSIDFNVNDEMIEMIEAFDVKPISTKITSNWMYYKISAKTIEAHLPLFKQLYNYKLKENE